MGAQSQGGAGCLLAFLCLGGAPGSPDCLAGGPVGGCPRRVMMRPPLARPCGKQSREIPTVRAAFRGDGQNMQMDSQCVRRRASPARSLDGPPCSPHTPAAAACVFLRPSRGPLGSGPRKRGLSPLSSGVSGRTLTCWADEDVPPRPGLQPCLAGPLPVLVSGVPAHRWPQLTWDLHTPPDGLVGQSQTPGLVTAALPLSSCY